MSEERISHITIESGHDPRLFSGTDLRKIGGTPFNCEKCGKPTSHKGLCYLCRNEPISNEEGKEGDAICPEHVSKRACTAAPKFKPESAAISNEAVEAARQAATRIGREFIGGPQNKGIFYEADLPRITQIVLDAITKAYAERERLESNEHSLAECPSKGLCAQCRLRRQLAVMKEALEEYRNPDRWNLFDAQWRWVPDMSVPNPAYNPQDVAILTLSNLPAAAEELLKELKALRDIKEAAHEWAAMFPLKGRASQPDQAVAELIVRQCSAIDAAMEGRSNQ